MEQDRDKYTHDAIPGLTRSPECHMREGPLNDSGDPFILDYQRIQIQSMVI